MYRLLIIEDEENIRENIKEIFELTGNKVFTASNGAEGIKIAVELKPDIILCDISMPILDGFQVKKNLSLNEMTSSIPFIYLTARADFKNMREGMELGADDYIIKPIHAAELLNIINQRMKRIAELRIPDDKKPKTTVLSYEDKIPLNIGKDRVFVIIKNIVVISVTGDYTDVFVNDGRKLIVKKSIVGWEKILPDKDFVKAHRNILINLNYIEKIEPWFNGVLIAKVKNYPEPIKFSKRYSQKIKTMLKQ